MKKYIRIIAVLLVITLMTTVMTACLSDASDTESPVNTSDTDVTDSSESNTPDKDDVSVENTSGSVSDDVSDDVSTSQADTPDEHTHQYGDWTTVKQATEKEEGSKKRVCDACGHEETAVIPLLSHTHSYEKWESDSAVHWKECKCGSKSEIASHFFSQWKTATTSTCTLSGTKQRNCDCGYSETVSVPTVSHKYVSAINLSTETEKGYTTHTCAYCGDKYVNSYTAPGFVYSEGLEYRVNNDGVSCVITGIGSCTDEIVNIPSVIDGYRVVTIDSEAFWNCSQLVKVTIPDTVTNIRLFSFSGCENLDYTVYDNALYLGNGDNPYYALISAVNKRITNCEIHPDTKIVAGTAFIECKSLAKVSIPDSVETIGFAAFSNCSELSEVNFGNGLRDIDGCAFDGCEKLTAIVIPDSVIAVGGQAFSNCVSLTNVVIGAGVTEIGSGAFYNCSELIDVSLGSSIEIIDGDAFVLCPKLKFQKYGNAYYLGNESNPYLALINADREASNITIHSSAKIIAGDAFYKCNIQSITIGSGVTHINGHAFAFCENLREITMYENLEYIGDGAFNHCYNLKNVYYKGSEAEWITIYIGDGNYDFTNATIHCK